MALCTWFFCFKDIQRAIVALGIFSLTTSLVQIGVSVSGFTAGAEIARLKLTFNPEDANATTYKLYIALSCADFFMCLFALLMLCGNESPENRRARCYFLPWVILLPFYMIYESAINVYYFYNQFNHLIYIGHLGAGTLKGFIIVPLVYWIIKDIILFIGFMMIITRIQNLTLSLVRTSQKSNDESCNCYSAPPRPGSAPVVTTQTYERGTVVPRCHRCNLPKAQSGYSNTMPDVQCSRQSGMQPSNGWTSTFYNNGR